MAKINGDDVQNKLQGRPEKPGGFNALMQAELKKVFPAIKTIVPRHMTPERLARMALTTISRTPKLAQCTPASLVGAVMNCAVLGLEPEKMFFRVVLADKSYNMAHKDFHDGDYEVGFFKLYYQLILHILTPENQYHLRLAEREVSKKVRNINEAGRLSDFKRYLNNAMRSKTMRNVVPTVEARPAKQRRLIQLADILMGAIGYHWNLEHLKENASQGKCCLANYIASKLGREDLRFTTSLYSRPFNIFYHQPGKK